MRFFSCSLSCNGMFSLLKVRLNWKTRSLWDLKRSSSVVIIKIVSAITEKINVVPRDGGQQWQKCGNVSMGKKKFKLWKCAWSKNSPQNDPKRFLAIEILNFLFYSDIGLLYCNCGIFVKLLQLFFFSLFWVHVRPFLLHLYVILSCRWLIFQIM